MNSSPILHRKVPERTVAIGIAEIIQRIALRFVLLALLCICAPAYADVATGMQWLDDRETATGVHLPSDLANASDTNAEAWITAFRLSRSAQFTQLTSVVQNQRDASLSSLARQARLRLDQGQSASGQLAELLALQQADGGFPPRAGFQSEVLTTTWVMLALDRAGQGSGTPASRALGYLLTIQQSDGGFLSAAGNLSSVFASAHVARVYADYRNRFSLTQPIARLTSFLQNARKPDQSFGESFETGFALDALLALRADRQALAPAFAALRARQAANGSFGDDAYVTAIAIRALWASEQPEANPTLAGLTARILSADTELPIAGAQLVLSGASNATQVSNNLGRMQSSTLPGGAYQAVLSFPGMRDISFAITLANGRVLDLGDLRMIQGSAPGADYALIRGRVINSETGSGIAGATLGLATPPTQVISDADGRFQFLQVPVGQVQISAAASGYSSRSITLTATPQTTIDLSLELAPTALVTGARIRGVIVNAQSSAPLSGVSIAVTAGAPLVSTLTNGSGTYELAVSAGALVTVTASLNGFDPVTIQVPLVDNEIVQFSPRLYPTGTTPTGANRATISGTVVNQGTRQPIQGALIIAVDPGGQRTTTSDSAGRFTISGLSGPTTQLRLSKDAFDPATVLVPILPLQVRDIGNVGLKPVNVDYYFPDLTIVDSNLSTSDPDSFQLSQSFTVEIINRGTSNTTQDFVLLAFIDANGNGVFESAVEPEVGRVRVDRDLPIANSVSINIAVNAQLSFRDAPVSFWVDAENEIPEQVEDNNVGSSLLACRIEPTPIGQSSVYEAWRWSGLSSNPDINSLAQVPSVTQLSDDNGDGVINEYDIPDIVFVAGLKNSIVPAVSALVAISGDGGSELWSRTDIRLSLFSSVATGDIDNDGVAEIVAVSKYREELFAFENDGSLKWRTPINGPGIPVPPIPPHPHVYDAPIIVNLEGDNEAEIVLGRIAFRGLNGERLWEGEFDAGGDGGKPPDRQVTAAGGIGSVAADVDRDGKMEIIAGRTLYNFNGTTRWHLSHISPGFYQDAVGTHISNSGYVAVGNFDTDDFAEIVLTIDKEIYLLEHTGEIIWGPKFSPNNAPMGAPSIADVDRDGLPEIFVSSSANSEGPGQLTVLESDGTLKRTIDINDFSGGVTPVVFDFQNDGDFEIVHSDEDWFKIFGAESNLELYRSQHTSLTVGEYPVVADIDGDKQADIIVVGTESTTPFPTPGIRVFKPVNGAWADAGSVWGSHSFHIDDVAEDSTIPLLETPSWLTHNTYRVQRSPTPDPLGMPDFSVGDLRLIDQGPGLDPVVTVRVGNAGPVDAHEPPFISLFRGDPATGGVLLKRLRLDSLRPSRFQIVNLGQIPRGGSGALYAIVDQQERSRECREINNQRNIVFAATNGLGDLQLSTDQLSYRPGDTAVLRATVANQGALPAGYRVEWLVRNAQGATTRTFDDLQFALINAGSSMDRTASWATAGVLAGSYVLSGRLLNADGALIDTATASFAIVGDVSGPAGGIGMSFSRASYAPGEVAALSFRARNLSSSEIIRLPEVVITITGPGGYNRQRALPYSDLFAGAFVDGEILAEGANAAGIYTATGRLRSRLTGIDYATDNVSFERLADLTASIQGFVDVALPSLQIGAAQNCLNTVRNRGTQAQPATSLRRSVVNLDTGAILLQQAFTADLIPGSDYVANETIVTTGYSAGDHACVLEIASAGSWRVLDSEPFTLLGLPGAGIVVMPTSGLVTSEAGQIAEFSVRLATQPSSDVLVSMQSSDATELYLPTTALTFTPANWNTPRTVGVIGVDDVLADGDIAATILLAPAQSADPVYQGQDPADVSVTNLDNDAVAIRVSPILVETSEAGTSATFSVSVNAQPSADVTVSVASNDVSEWSIDRASLTFNNSNWLIAQTVTVTGIDDAELDGLQTGSILIGVAVSVDTRFNGIDPLNVIARNADDEGAAIIVEPTAVTTAENGLPGSFTVRLNAVPSAPVIIPIGPIDSSEWRVLDLDVRLTAANWQTGQSIQVTPVDDTQVDGNQSALLILGVASSIDSRFNGVNPTDVALTNLDDDGPQILVNPTTGLIVSESGSTDTFSVRLTEVPSANVTISVSSGDASEFAVSPSLLTFTPQSFGAQTVTITGVDDVLVDGNIAGLIVLAPAQSSDARYLGIDPPDISATNIDDEVVQVVVTPQGSIETREDGSSANIEVRLSAQPSADVVIALANPDTSEWAFDRSELRFTAANWTAPQVVVVSGVNDFEIDGDVLGVIGLGTISSADPRYNGFNPPDVPAVNRDDDVAAAILVSPVSGLQTSELGGSASFQVRLSTQPSAEVSVALTNPDVSEFLLDRSEVRFAPADWATPRAVTITGVDDAIVDGNITGTIALNPAVSADPRFDAINPADVSVVNIDNEVVQVLVSPTVGIETSEAGSTATIEMRLSAAPTADVVSALINPDPTEWSFDRSELRFTPTNWESPQILTVSGVNDFEVDGDIAASIILGVLSSADERYQGLNPPDVPAINLDNDVAAAILVSPAGPLETTEAGGSASFEVRLSTEPSSVVRIALSNPDTTEFSLDRSEVEFLPADWQSARVVTVTGVDDNLLDGDISAVIGLAPAVSQDARFNAIDPPDMPVINRNDDLVAPASLLVNDLDLSVSEAGDSGRIEIALNRAPSSPVRLVITSANLGEVLATNALEFTPANATNPQPIVLSGVDEFIDDGDRSVLLTIAVRADSDPDFVNLAPIVRTVINLDNDTAGIALNAVGATSITEGQSAALELRLASEPVSAVTIALEASLRAPGQPGALIFELQPLSVTVQPAQWLSASPLLLITRDNGLANPDQIVDVRIVSVTSSDALYAAQLAAPVAIAIEDRGVLGLQPVPADRLTWILAILLTLSGAIWLRSRTPVTSNLKGRE